MLEGRLSPALEGHSCGKRLAAALLSVPLLVALAVTTVARALAVRDEQGEQLAVLARGRVRHERRSRPRRVAGAFPVSAMKTRVSRFGTFAASSSRSNLNAPFAVAAALSVTSFAFSAWVIGTK